MSKSKNKIWLNTNLNAEAEGSKNIEGEGGSNEFIGIGGTSFDIGEVEGRLEIEGWGEVKPNPTGDREGETDIETEGVGVCVIERLKNGDLEINEKSELMEVGEGTTEDVAEVEILGVEDIHGGMI